MSYLVLLPHCDDEYFLSLFLKKWRVEEKQVSFVFIIDHKREDRRRESTRFLTDMGFSSESILFLSDEMSVLDGQLYQKIPEVIEVLKPKLEGVQRVYTTSWEGGHHDHDALAWIVQQLTEDNKSIEKWFFSTYNGATTIGPFFSVNRPITGSILNLEFESFRSRFDVVSHYRSAFEYYPSQTKTWLGLGPSYLWNQLINMRQSTFRMRDILLDQTPHDGVPLYERHGRVTWSEMKAEIGRSV